MSGAAPSVAAGARAGAGAARRGTPALARGLPRWWPLAALLVGAAILRLATLGEQSLWYDEAFTPVHVLRASLFTTLRGVVRSENTPPLWYVLEWGFYRVLGSGVVALRLLSALAGIATVAVAWAIGSELEDRAPHAGVPRVASATAAFVAVNPLFVWYSQEARAYGLFVLCGSLALLCFLRALREPSRARLAAFALCAALALLSHYFAVFLLVPMVAWLVLAALRSRVATDGRRAAERATGGQVAGEPPARGSSAWAGALPRVLWAVAVPALVGAALIPLILAQGGHGTQWIGEWALTSRLEAIPQYYLTGYTGAALGHGVELLIALAILAGVVWGLWCTLTPREERSAVLVLVVCACGVLIPVALALVGVDYLAPRNLVAAMVPLSALLALVIVAQRTGRVGAALAVLVAAGFLAVTIDVDLSPRLQRGDWRGVAAAIESPPTPAGIESRPARAIVTVELGSAPLEYYVPGIGNAPARSTVRVDEIDEIGYAPLRPSAQSPPVRGFRLVRSSNVHGLVVYRFTSSVPVSISARVLRESAITEEAHPEVLIWTASSGKTH